MSYQRLAEENLYPVVDEGGADVENSIEQRVQCSYTPLHNLNADQFFTDIYRYHQSGGFCSIFVVEVLWLVKFAFVVFIGVELTCCTRWEMLVNRSVSFIEWSDVFTPPGQCWSSLPLLPSILFTSALVLMIAKLMHTCYRLRLYWDIRRFFARVLGLPVSGRNLSDHTWSEVQMRLLNSQEHLKLSHSSTRLDELDIHHIILRRKNYLIAMIVKDILPVRFCFAYESINLPVVYLPDGYLFNLKLLLFHPPWSPFDSEWNLKRPYKDFSRSYDLAAALAMKARFLGVINLILAPVILVFQFIFFVCSNAERIRYQPSAILGRRWSNYARIYFRHYNELHHQFVYRIARAYEPACQYLDSFSSQTIASLAEAGAFIFGSSSLAFLLMGLVHEQSIHLSGYWLIVVLGGMLARVCLGLIPDENTVYVPQSLMMHMLKHIHYVPEHWKTEAATYSVSTEFSQFFQYRWVGALEQLVSAIVTPLLLIFVLPKHSLEIVNFLRNYTARVRDLGDGCSFAQLNVAVYGDPSWRPPDESVDLSEEEAEKLKGVSSSITARSVDITAGPVEATGGRIELSLMHFHLTNPSWNLPNTSRAYLHAIHKQAITDIRRAQMSTQLQDTSKGIGDSMLPQELTSTLIQSLHRADSELTRSGTVIKKASHLPGPTDLPDRSLGVVSAMVESMHRSDPGVSQTSPEIQDRTLVTRDDASLNIADKSRDFPVSTEYQPPSSTYPATAGVYEVPPSSSSAFVRRTGLSPYSAKDSPIYSAGHQPYAALIESRQLNKSKSPVSVEGSRIIHAMQLASFPGPGTDSSGYFNYNPYSSQTEESILQQLGASSIAYSASGVWNAFTNLSTVDRSASIIYMHGLHKRRQQKQDRMLATHSGHLSSDRFGGAGGGTSSGSQYDAFRTVLNADKASYGHAPGISSGVYVPETHFTSGYTTSVDERFTLTSILPTGYGSMRSEPVVMRTRFPQTQIDEVTEEEDIPAAVPTILPAGMTSHDSLRGYQLPEVQMRHLANPTTTGVVAVAGSPRLHSRFPSGTSPIQDVPDLDSPPAALTDDGDAGPVWPNLPPTNC